MMGWVVIDPDQVFMFPLQVVGGVVEECVDYYVK